MRPRPRSSRRSGRAPSAGSGARDAGIGRGLSPTGASTQPRYPAAPDVAARPHPNGFQNRWSRQYAPKRGRCTTTSTPKRGALMADQMTPDEQLAELRERIASYQNDPAVNDDAKLIAAAIELLGVSVV